MDGWFGAMQLALQIIKEDSNMINDAEKRVANFYNTVGWETNENITEDARRWEDLRENAKKYVSKCRLRVLKYIPESGANILDMASGPIQYKEYLEYSRGFKKRYCVDLSLDALKSAEKKIGDHGVYLHGSFLEIPIEENFFDCTVSLHTIYHIDKDRQEEAVRKLIRVTKQGMNVIIVYGNPHTIISFIRLPIRLLNKLRFLLLKKEKNVKQEEVILYYYVHPIKWWYKFSDIANVNILPWRSFDSDIQKKLIPNNKIGGKMLEILFNLEDKFPNFFAKYFQYPMIILTKK